MKNTKKYISCIVLSVFFLSNTFTGVFPFLSSDKTYAASNPYELKKIVYEGGVEEFTSEHWSSSEDQSGSWSSSEWWNQSGDNDETTENLLDIDDYWDMRFIGDHLYVFVWWENASLKIYDRQQNFVNSVDLPTTENSHADFMLYDKAEQKIGIGYWNDAEGVAEELHFYDLDGTLAEMKYISPDVLGYDPNTEWIWFDYSQADGQIIGVIQWGNSDNQSQTSIVTLDGTILHTFNAADFGAYDTIGFWGIVSNGYILWLINSESDNDWKQYFVDASDGLHTLVTADSMAQ